MSLIHGGHDQESSWTSSRICRSANSPSSPSSIIPFLWEEEPGVSKEHHLISSIISSPAIHVQQFHRPPATSKLPPPPCYMYKNGRLAPADQKPRSISLPLPPGRVKHEVYNYGAYKPKRVRDVIDIQDPFLMALKECTKTEFSGQAAVANMAQPIVRKNKRDVTKSKFNVSCKSSCEVRENNLVTNPFRVPQYNHRQTITISATTKQQQQQQKYHMYRFISSDDTLDGRRLVASSKKYA